MRKQRAALSETAQVTHSRTLCQKLATHPSVSAANTIAIYTPMFGEISPLPLLGLLPSQFYLPVVQADKTLLFAPYNNQSVMTKNCFQIPEPLVDKGQLVSAKTIDIICLPLLAATQQGARLGMGGGYYDRTLAFLLNSSSARQPTLIGLAYDFQLIETLPNDSHDIKLDFILSPANS